MKTVLFICVGNTCRSQMAKGFYNSLTSNQSADSAGTQPEDRVNPSAVKVMKEVNIDISCYTPKSLTTEMYKRFDLIVTMGCDGGCPLTPREKTITWSIEDPKGKSLATYRKVRDIIYKNVILLITDSVDFDKMRWSF